MNERIPPLGSAKPRSEFAHFIRFLRQRVDPSTSHLGPYARLSSRRGRRVTQEEIAEAVGISREWFAVLETTATNRISPGLLGRVADALMATPEERSQLFQLAIPDVWRPQRCEDARATSSTTLETKHGNILHAFARVRSSAKRLWSASTVSEALEMAAEEVTYHFTNADVIVSFHRVARGRWNHLLVADRGLGKRHADMLEGFASSLPCTGFDEILFYPQLTEPGDLGSRDMYGATVVGSAYEEGLVRHELTRWSFLHARIHSRCGIVGGVTVKHACQRDYSDTDRAIMSAIASLASLALP
jgi:transcriptional regulator with XRE-family HTH domain